MRESIFSGQIYFAIKSLNHVEEISSLQKNQFSSKSVKMVENLKSKTGQLGRSKSFNCWAKLTWDKICATDFCLDILIHIYF